MSIAWITAQQMLIMLLYMCCGVVLSRRKLVTEEGSKAIAALLIYLVIPMVIIHSFLSEQSAEKNVGLAASIGLAALCLLLAILVARAIFLKRPMEEFSAEFSNAGFLGIPLISATLGQENVFYAAGYVALLNILQWSYGQSRLGVPSRFWKSMLLSPLVLSFLLGLLLYFTQLKLPEILTECISSIAACNSPLAMMLLGIYLGETDIKRRFATSSVWAASGVRLVLIPVATLALLTVIPINTTLKMTLFLVSAAPAGSNVAMYAQRANLDPRDAIATVCLSTLLSIISIPLLTELAARLWNFH